MRPVLARGRYPARFNAPALDPGDVAHYRLFWPGRMLYHSPEHFPPVTSQGLFDRDAPLFLDLGCGTGDFLCALAARSPGACFLGVETAGKLLDRAVWMASRAELDNVRFLQADATLVAPRLLPGTVQAAYILFPVPFHTSKKRKHYVYSPAVFAHLLRGLVPGGRVGLVTDDASVAEDVQGTTASQHGWRLAQGDELALVGADAPRSPYQRLWEARGRSIWRVELVKQAPV